MKIKIFTKMGNNPPVGEFFSHNVEIEVLQKDGSYIKFNLHANEEGELEVFTDNRIAVLPQAQNHVHLRGE